MIPDQHAQLKQIREHAMALRVDISGARAAGADRKGIEAARWHLACAYTELTEAITKGEQKR